MDKREQILEAAAALIAKDGLQCCPMAKIAKNAGCGAGTIYRYFSTKEDLVLELLFHLSNKLEASCLGGLSDCSSIRDKFDHVWGCFYRFMLANPTEMALLEQLHASPVLNNIMRAQAMTKFKSEVLAFLEDGRNRGHIKPLHDDLLLTVTFGSLLNIAKRQSQDFLPIFEAAPEQSILDMCWDAISTHH